MTTFLEFLEAAADFAPTLNLKAAIVATGFIVMLMPRADEAPNSTQGKGPPARYSARKEERIGPGQPSLPFIRVERPIGFTDCASTSLAGRNPNR